jgi:hypothetical protein
VGNYNKRCDLFIDIIDGFLKNFTPSDLGRFNDFPIGVAYVRDTIVLKNQIQLEPGKFDASNVHVDPFIGGSEKFFAIYTE